MLKCLGGIISIWVYRIWFIYRALPSTHIYWTKKRHVLLIFVDLRTFLLERHKRFVFAQERKRNFIE